MVCLCVRRVSAVKDGFRAFARRAQTPRPHVTYVTHVTHLTLVAAALPRCVHSPHCRAGAAGLWFCFGERTLKNCMILQWDKDSYMAEHEKSFWAAQTEGLTEGSRRSPRGLGAATSGQWRTRSPAPQQGVPDWFLGLGAQPEVQFAGPGSGTPLRVGVRQ